MDWHTRYVQQAGWTAQLRAYLFQKARLSTARRVLDLGCGTGALLENLPVQAATAVFGLDLSLDSVQQAARHRPGFPDLRRRRLPALSRGRFRGGFFHFVLLWTPAPLKILAEMRRVTRPGGAVLALAEPDYGGRIDYPFALARLGNLQAESLRQQGADPEMGRKLAGLFAQAGLKHIESGVMGGEWASANEAGDTLLEWKVLEADLARRLPLHEIQKLKDLELSARQSGERVLFVPTFYAWGRV